eukprot:scaffold297433_cov27-Tisochrysis_lutea.AAC.1
MWYEKLGEAVVHLGLGRWADAAEAGKENGTYFIIDKPGNIFSWDQMGVQVKLSEASAGNDWTWRFHGDGGEVVSEKGAKKRTVTGGCTLDARALPALVTDQQSGQCLADMKDPPRSGFRHDDGTPRVAAF